MMLSFRISGWRYSIPFYTNWNKSEPYTSTDTATDKIPYSNSFTKGALYCGENLESDLEKS